MHFDSKYTKTVWHVCLFMAKSFGIKITKVVCANFQYNLFNNNDTIYFTSSFIVIDVLVIVIVKYIIDF